MRLLKESKAQKEIRVPPLEGDPAAFRVHIIGEYPRQEDTLSRALEQDCSSSIRKMAKSMGWI